MTLRGCSYSHFICSVKDGVMKKVHNMDLHGRPSLKFKKLEEIYQHADVECTPMPLAERETSERNWYGDEENGLDFPSKENSLEELTLSQIKKKLKRKKRKASVSVLLTPKAEKEEDSFDLTQPLCKFRVKVSKSSRSKRVSANGNLPTSSRGAQLVTSELSKDLTTVSIKVEAPELEYFESFHDLKRGELESFTNEGGKCDFNEVSEVELFESNHNKIRGESESFTNEGKICKFNEVPDVEFFESNHDSKRGESELFTNEGGKCDFNEVPDVEFFESNHDSKRGESELFTNEGEKCDFNEVPEVELFESNHDKIRESESFLNEGEICEFNEVHDVEFSESNHDPKRGESESFTKEGENCEFNEVLFDSVGDIKNMEMDNEETIATLNQSPSILNSLENDSFFKDPTASAFDCSRSQLYLQQTSDQSSYISAVQDSDPTFDVEHDEDVVSMEGKSPIFEENKNLTPMDIDQDPITFNSDDISVVIKDISIPQELLSTVPEITGSEVKLDHKDQTGAMSEASESRQSERLPLTRKFISPNSQEKLCQAMKSTESLYDIEHFKCKEKLYFEEQPENMFSSTKSDVEDNELNAHPQQATQVNQNKALISSKYVLKRPRNYKKVSPTKKGIAPKGCLDGPRLCRSLPRLSTGCTSIEGCSESAIAFSQRQMHDIESLASKLMSELNSMRVIVEEKMLYEAYRSTLKNEADEVKSAIKSATKTEETAKKWLSMMSRDCTRFCKIMKLNEDYSTSASVDPALGNTNQEKPIVREKKKISFADETGGTLCDIKVYQVEQEPSLSQSLSD